MQAKKNRLLIVISIILITAFAVTSLVSFYVSRSLVRSQIDRNELPLTSDTIYSEIQRDLLRPIFISSLMANDTFLRDWVLDGEQDTVRVIRYLKEIQVKYNTFTSFFVSDKTMTYYHADGILKKVDPDRPRDVWYFRVRDMAEDYEINVDLDMANQDAMTIFINYRVYDYDHNFIGVTGVGLTVNAVMELVEMYKRNFDRNIFFVDAKGLVVLSGSDFNHESDNLFTMEDISSLAAQIVSTESGTYRYTHRGKVTHLNTRYIPEFKWYLLVEKTEDREIGRITNTLYVNLTLSAVITVVIVLLINGVVSMYQSKLEKMATTDKLTGIFNRQAFDIILSQHIQELQRNEAPLSIILFDIDRFKQTNDTFGHLAGDRVLQHIADVTRTTMRSSDVFCRWGGEEFIVLLKNCSSDNACAMAQKIRAALKAKPAGYKGRNIPVTVSLGVTAYQAPESEDSLLNRADNALYQAKNNGRDRIEKL